MTPFSYTVFQISKLLWILKFLRLWKLSSSAFCNRYFCSKLCFSQYSLLNHSNCFIWSSDYKVFVTTIYKQNVRISVRRIHRSFLSSPHPRGQCSSCLRLRVGSSLSLWDVLPAKAAETGDLWKRQLCALSPALFVIIRYGCAYEGSVNFVKNIYYIQIIFLDDKPDDRKCQHP